MAKFHKFLAVSLVTALILFSPEVLAQRSSENPRAIEIWLVGPVRPGPPLPSIGPLAWFVATTTDRETTVATTIMFYYLNKKEEEDSPDIVETPERRQFVDKMIAELTEEGWKPAGMGQYWYSYRFRR
jgi:hypothetical protein